jgi:hypothetical protein
MKSDGWIGSSRKITPSFPRTCGKIKMERNIRSQVLRILNQAFNLQVKIPKKIRQDEKAQSVP